MSNIIIAPNFPIITWQVDFSDANYEIVITGADVDSGTCTINLNSGLRTAGGTGAAINTTLTNQLLGGLWGCAPGVVNTCEPESLSGWLRDVINDPAVMSAGGDVLALYTWPTTTAANRGTPSTRWLRGAGADTITVSFYKNSALSTDLGKRFGFNSSSFNILYLTPTNTTFNSCCYWAPYPMYTTRDLRSYVDPVFITENSDGSVVEAVRWGSRKRTRLLEYPTVFAADVYEYRRDTTGFATPAQRNIADPNNLLEDLWEAAALGKLLRVYSNNEVYREAYMTDQAKVREMSTSLEDISAREAMFQVNLMLRDLGT
jgi:hypothetical protein